MDVTSFKIDHNKLLRGIYVSRKDKLNDETVTTFDIRMKEPNREPIMDNSVMHTLEHLIAVYIRSDDSGWKDEVLYIGPMGCRTGMYLLCKGDLEPDDVLGLMQAAFEYIIGFEGKVPYTEPEECGNYLDHNLFFTVWEAKKYFNEVLADMKDENKVYP
jgi:S-ribosylhomocysteine lyase